MTDSDLVQQALAGDPEAFAALVHRHGPGLYARLLRQVRAPAEAEDLLQEVLLRAYARLEQVQDPSRLGAWLGVLADNQVRQWRRRRWVQLRWQEQLSASGERLFLPAEEPSPLAEQKALVRAALSRLSAAYRQVLVHHYLKGYSYQETAQRLGLPVETVRSRLQKGRKRLKKELEHMAGQQTPFPTFTLSEADLRALRWARAFVSTDPQRPVLQGVYLDAGGTMVATDGARLFLWEAQSLKGLKVPLLLGPWSGGELPAAQEARLTVGLQEALLRFPDGTERAVPLMEGPYVKYEQVLPPEGGLRVQVEAGPLREALELMAAHLAPRHPVEPEKGWSYCPRVEVYVSALEQRLVLVTTRDMGYVQTEEKTKPRLSREGADWTFTASVPARLQGGEEVFRMAVNHTFLSAVVQALEVKGKERIEVQVSDPHQVIRFRVPKHPNRQTLLMPLKWK